MLITVHFPQQKRFSVFLILKKSILSESHRIQVAYMWSQVGAQLPTVPGQSQVAAPTHLVFASKKKDLQDCPWNRLS